MLNCIRQLYWLGYIAEAVIKKDYKNALIYINGALEIYPDYSPSALGSKDSIFNYFTLKSESAKLHSFILMAKTMVLYRLGYFDEALSTMCALLSCSTVNPIPVHTPTDLISTHEMFGVVAWDGLSEFLLELGRFQEAYEAKEIAVKLDKVSADSNKLFLSRSGFFLICQNKAEYTQAEQAFQQALDKKNLTKFRQEDIQLRLVFLLLLQNKISAANALIMKMIPLQNEGDENVLLLNLAKSLINFRLNDLTKYDECFPAERAVVIIPPSYHYLKGLCLMEFGALEEAKACFEQVQILMPQGQSHLPAKDKLEALEAERSLREALTATREIPELLLQLNETVETQTTTIVLKQQRIQELEKEKEQLLQQKQELEKQLHLHQDRILKLEKQIKEKEELIEVLRGKLEEQAGKIKMLEGRDKENQEIFKKHDEKFKEHDKKFKEMDALKTFFEEAKKQEAKNLKEKKSSSKSLLNTSHLGLGGIIAIDKPTDKNQIEIGNKKSTIPVRNGVENPANS